MMLIFIEQKLRLIVQLIFYYEKRIALQQAKRRRSWRRIENQLHAQRIHQFDAAKLELQSPKTILNEEQAQVAISKGKFA